MSKSEPKKPRRSSKKELVNKAIQAFENKLDQKNVTVSEFVKLLELEKEMGGKLPKEIKTTWVYPGEAEPPSEK